MKYLKFIFKGLKKYIKNMGIVLLPYILVVFFVIIGIAADGYTLEDFGIDGFTVNPNDYCNLTDVDYTAVLHDDIDGKANVEITEYLTFDVHASSKSNTFKELWRELPEEEVDGLKVTYDVKSVTQILDNGEEIPYEETSKMYWEDEDYTMSATKRWHHSKGNGRYPDNDESLLIYIPWTYREKLKFKIVYSLNNAALKYKDCSELYLSMYSGNTITKLKSYKAQILVPDELMPETYYAYTYGTANSRIPYNESNSINPGYHTFSINLEESDLKFNFYDRYIEFCLLAYGNDKHIFTKYAPNNLYSNDNALQECMEENEYYETLNKRYKNYKSLLLILSVLGASYTVYRTKKLYNDTKKTYTFYKPETDYEYFREIPSDLDPFFASELVFMDDPFNENKEKKEEYAAILLSLVRKKYVKIVKNNEALNWTKENTVIVLEPVNSNYIAQDSLESQNNPIESVNITVNTNTGEKLEQLTTSERIYYELLERHIKGNGSIKLSDLQRHIDTDYGYTNSFVKNMEKKPALETGVIGGYFQNAKYDSLKNKFSEKANTSLVFALIMLIIVNGISYFTPMALGFGAYTIFGIALIWKFIYLSSKSGELVLFTQYGANEQAKWRGLYNFLNSDTLLNEKEVRDLVLWEKYLIYATAFGISEKVVKAIKINAVELKIDDSSILNRNCYIHSHHFHTMSRSFGHSIHTTSRGGGFSGHGYGGGGRGGGGGGGGH